MRKPDGSPDERPPGVSFVPTRWSVVQRALLGGEPLNTWVGMYWFPLYAWARHRGMSPEDSSDQVQAFLHRLCRKNLLEQADPARGRLRSWLLRSFHNHLHSSARDARSRRRGGGAPHLSIDRKLAESVYLTEHNGAGFTPEQVYSRAWALTLMDEALESLATHYRNRGRDDLFEALSPALETPLPDVTSAEVAARFGMTPTAIRQTVVRMRQRYRRLLLETAGKRLGITCEARLAEELREMLSGLCHNIRIAE